MVRLKLQVTGAFRPGASRLDAVGKMPARSRQIFRRMMCAALLPAVLAGCLAQKPTPPRASASEEAGAQVVIRRTADGVPHIEARSWTALGYGYGYAQAQDNLCTLADAFVTYRGERSAFFGADAKPPTRATFGSPRNIDADFFFRLLDGREQTDAYRAHQPDNVRQLIAGFAQGYNRYLATLRAAPDTQAHAACRNERWVSDISETDIYRRLAAANFVGGYTGFIEALADAHPPAVQLGQAAPQRVASLGAELGKTYLQAGGVRDAGSNALAFGAHVTGSGQSVLFGNPHWFWQGPDRFYQAQLTLPGQLDVSGVSFLGVPVVMIGYNRNVAWTHTVSSARRFGLFQLSLVPGKPTVYRIDGRDEPMTQQQITVAAKQADGTSKPVTRTFYRSRFGPVVDLHTMSPALAWNGTQAFAVRDSNADNYAIFENFLRWGQALSLDEFIATQKRLAATPWVNTVAIGRDDPRVWFADIGSMPNVDDAFAATCTAKPLGAAFDARMPGVPFLDGSRSACQWPMSKGAVRAGALPVDDMPSLLRTDYVANMNNSYGLANPQQPLSGYPRVAGDPHAALSLRAQLGHEIARSWMALPAGQRTLTALGKRVLDTRTLTAERFLPQVFQSVCAGPDPVVQVDKDRSDGAALSAPQTVRLAAACKTLRAWPMNAETDSHGAVLWEAFWSRIEAIPVDQRYAVPFSMSAPLSTPDRLRADDPRVGEALGAAVLALQRAGLAVDAPTGASLYTSRSGKRVALFGGCSESGYFVSACPIERVGAGESSHASMDGAAIGNSYMQIVSFGPKSRVIAKTLLAPSESDDPASPASAEGTLDYARKTWRNAQFDQADIEREEVRSQRVTLTVPAPQD
ncbi:penicillin acylase family protein [Paraburkholderia sediminicola]|uniref:penicillin acylase family protein n=1 Tax=Paraburkholderia TaxID=1822464 RepID=UPI0038BBF6B2